jgi:hypothetical protein
MDSRTVGIRLRDDVWERWEGLEERRVVGALTRMGFGPLDIEHASIHHVPIRLAR